MNLYNGPLFPLWPIKNHHCSDLCIELEHVTLSLSLSLSLSHA